jgi:hypothetical protein
MATHRAKLASLLALALGGGALVAGCGESGGERPQGPESEPAAAQGERAEPGESDSGGVDQSGSITQRSEGGSGGDSSTSITQDSTGGSSTSSSSQSSSGGRGTSIFSGSGRTNLSFNVERPSRLSWTNTEGKAFSAEGSGISISSRAGRGEAELRRRSYDDVEVRGANWTIVVRPR